jgi:8-oxo-dGTP pyrophosphatase MutT (NUDIX family)
VRLRSLTAEPVAPLVRTGVVEDTRRRVTRKALVVVLICAHRVRLVYWWLVRPKRSGVKVALTCGSEILLVWHTYMPGWNLPGGGYRPRRETPEEAGRREIRQELGLDLGTVTVLGAFESKREHKRDTITCLRAEISRSGTVSSAEIREARWFDRDALPESLDDVNQEALRLLG